MKQILILGGGPAGLQLIKTLRVARLKADITLVDRSESYTPNTRYGVFFGRSEPYKTRASSALLFTALAKKYDFTFVQAEVLGVDLAKRQAQLQGRRLEADVLVLALGSAYKEQVSSVFKHSYPVWTLDQLFELQKLLEAALQAKKMQAKGEPLRIVLIGGGIVGLSLAFGLSYFVTKACKLHQLPVEDVEIVLLEKTGSLAHLNSANSAKLAEWLRGAGVKIKYHHEAVATISGGVLVKGLPEPLPSEITIWAGGTNSTTKQVDSSGKFRIDQPMLVNKYFQVRGHDKVLCIGDQARIPIIHRLPSLFEILDEAKYAAKVVAGLLENRLPEPYTPAPCPVYIETLPGKFLRIYKNSLSDSLFNSWRYKKALRRMLWEDF